MFKHLCRRVVLVGQDGLAVRIDHLGIADRFRIIAIVRQRSIRLRHLAHGRTVGQAAERHRRVIDIRILQRRKAELFGQEIIGRLRSQHLEHLNRNGVGRIRNALHNGRLAVIAAVFVSRPRRAAVVEHRHVGDDRIGRNKTLINCRCIGADRLDGRAG